MQLERQKETPALDVVGFLDFTCCTRFSIANEYTDEVYKGTKIGESAYVAREWAKIVTLLRCLARRRTDR